MSCITYLDFDLNESSNKLNVTSSKRTEKDDYDKFFKSEYKKVDEELSLAVRRINQLKELYDIYNQQVFEIVIEQKRYNTPSTGNTYSRSLTKRVSGMMPFPFADALLAVKSEITSTSAEDLKSITAFTFLGSAISAAFGVDFIVLFIIMFFVALIDGILVAFFKVAREPKTKKSEHQPLARLGMFALLMLVFIGMSVVQIGINFVVWKNQGKTINELLADYPGWINTIAWMVNAQTLAAFAIIGYYGNRMRMTLQRATGINLLSRRKNIN